MRATVVAAVLSREGDAVSTVSGRIVRRVSRRILATSGHCDPSPGFAERQISLHSSRHRNSAVVRPESVRCHRSVRATRSRDSRYGARYLAAILVGGDQVGSSLVCELDPCLPLRRVVMRSGLSLPNRIARISGFNGCGVTGAAAIAAIDCAAVSACCCDPAVLNREVGAPRPHTPVLGPAACSMGRSK